MNLVDHVHFPIVYAQHVFPVCYFPHVGPWSSQVPHHLSHSIHTVNTITHPDRRQPRRSLEHLQYILPFRAALHLDHSKVQVSNVEGTLSGHSGDVEFRNNSPRVRALMRWNMSLWNHRVDQTGLVALPGVRSSPEQYDSSLSDA